MGNSPERADKNVASVIIALVRAGDQNANAVSEEVHKFDWWHGSLIRQSITHVHMNIAMH